jgi:hypothetical protein
VGSVDCGLRIVECGFQVGKRFFKSKIRNPKSQIEMPAHAGGTDQQWLAIFAPCTGVLKNS